MSDQLQKLSEMSKENQHSLTHEQVNQEVEMVFLDDLLTAVSDLPMTWYDIPTKSVITKYSDDLNKKIPTLEERKLSEFRKAHQRMIESRIYQKRFERFTSLIAKKEQHTNIIPDLEEYLWHSWELWQLDCSKFVSMYTGLPAYVESIDKILWNKDLAIDKVQPWDVVIWRGREGNHIEIVVDYPIFDSSTATYLVKTLWSAKSSPAFDFTGQDIVSNLELWKQLLPNKWVGYGVWYRVREIVQTGKTTFQELNGAGHDGDVIHFESLGKKYRLAKRNKDNNHEGKNPDLAKN